MSFFFRYLKKYIWILFLIRSLINFVPASWLFVTFIKNNDLSALFQMFYAMFFYSILLIPFIDLPVLIFGLAKNRKKDKTPLHLIFSLPIWGVIIAFLISLLSYIGVYEIMNALHLDTSFLNG